MPQTSAVVLYVCYSETTSFNQGSCQRKTAWNIVRWRSTDELMFVVINLSKCEQFGCWYQSISL